MPQLISRFVRRGARLMTIQTNDAWVGKTSGPYQHFALAVLRAVENRIPIIRCANTGVSGFIAASGIVSNKVPLDQAAVFKASAMVPVESSFYSRFGDIFVYLCLVGLIFIMGLKWKNLFAKY